MTKIALLSQVDNIDDIAGQFAFGAFGSLNTYGVTKEVLAAYILAQVGTDIVAGTDKQIQFNEGGAFGASSNLTFDYNTGNLSVNGNVFATLVNGVALTAVGVGDAWLDNAGNYTVPVAGAGGANFNVQFNDNGVIAGDGNFNWNKNTATLTINGRISGIVAPVAGNDAANKDYVDAADTVLQGNIDANAANIAANANNILINAAAIAVNNADISTNASNIATNNADISTNAGNIAANTADILLRIPTAEKGAANGVATLDGGGVIPISQIPSSVQGGIKVIGSWDANTNTPDLSALTLDQGEAYIVSVAGNTNLNGQTNWKVKDLAVWSDSLAGNYYKLDNTDDVLSVNGKTGVVVLVAADIADFQSTVSANADVAANTAARHDAVTLNADAKTQDALALSGQEIQIKLDVYDKANETGVEQITGGIITPPALAAQADDYNPAGFSTANMIRQDVTGADQDISGFVAPPVGVNRIIHICDISSSGFRIVFLNNHAGSVAANRLLLRDNNDRSTRVNETASFWYDHTSQRWRQFSQIG